MDFTEDPRGVHSYYSSNFLVILKLFSQSRRNIIKVTEKKNWTRRLEITEGGKVMEERRLSGQSPGEAKQVEKSPGVCGAGSSRRKCFHSTKGCGEVQ